MFRRGKDRAAVPVDDADRTAVDAARRDPLQFEALYRKYVAQVYSFALYELGERHAAEDLTAQVFLRALAGLPRFREQTPGPGSSFKIWLFQIARNALANERRRARRHPSAPLDDLALEIPDATGSGDPVRAVAQREQLREAWEHIRALPDDRRRALVLRFAGEMSTREIGRILGRSEGATRVLIHRSLTSVATQLGRRSSRTEARSNRATN